MPFISIPAVDSKRNVALVILAVLPGVISAQTSIELGDCAIFPTNNVWNTPVDTLPVDANSSAYVNSIGSTRTMHPDFGSGTWDGGPIGIPFITVSGLQTPVSVSFYYDDESDPGPYPIPSNAPIEGGPNSSGDRHVIVVDRDNCILYEVYDSHPQGNGSWEAGSGAVFDLKSNALRPDGWTSADAAGLPILPGLVRYDEVASGEIRHALRFTAPQTRRAYVWPARHYASSLTGSQYPPMGQRFRLKASFNITGFSPEVQVILRALKKYGMILADNGSAWYLSGAPDERWDNDVLRELHQVPGSAFEAVDCSSLMVDPDSAAVNAGSTDVPPPPPPTDPGTDPGPTTSIIDDTDDELSWQGSWKRKKNSMCHQGGFRQSSKRNASAGFTFDGTKCTWITARGPKFGRASIVVDGEPVATVDLHNPTLEWQHEVAIDGLSDGPHSVQIRVLGERGGQSRGKAIVFDGFSVP